jgi:HSP20 family protein
MAVSLFNTHPYRFWGPAEELFFFPRHELVNNDRFDKLEIHQTKDGAQVIHAAVPGHTKDNIAVQVDDGFLTITSNNSEAITNSDDSDHEGNDGTGGSCSHHFQRSFQRRVKLPRNADVGNITAKVEHGVMTVKVPKHPDAGPITVDVQ